MKAIKEASNNEIQDFTLEIITDIYLYYNQMWINWEKTLISFFVHKKHKKLHKIILGLSEEIQIFFVDQKFVCK